MPGLRSARRVAVAVGAVLLVTATVSGGGVAVRPVSAADGQFRLAGERTEFVHGDFVDVIGDGVLPGRQFLVHYCAENTPVPAHFHDVVRLGGTDLTFQAANCSTNPAWSPENYLGAVGQSSADAQGQVHARMWLSTVAQTLEQDVADGSGTRVPVTLTCDQEHPCRLVVVDAADDTVAAVLPVRFAAPFATSCGLPSDAKTPRGAGPYSMTPLYQRWAVDSCARGDDPELLADFAEAGESEALRQFQLGNNDFALSTVGPRPPGGVAVEGSRGAWLVPVSLQAAVVAFEGYEVTLPDPVNFPETLSFNPVPELQATWAELATLYSTANPDPAVEAGLAEMYSRNPPLQRMADLVGGIGVVPMFLRGGTLVTPDGATLAVTSAFSTQAGGVWTRGPQHGFPDLGGANDLFSGFPGLNKAAVQQPNNPAQIGLPRPSGVRLYVTDSTSAARVGLTPVRVRNTAGQFVAPNAGSLAAGVAGMTRATDGTLLPDPAVEDPNAYPLPLVTYAIVGQDVPVARRQAMLDFLQYAVIGAQRPDALPPGAFPLTPELKLAARDLLAQISAAWAIQPSRQPDPSPGPGQAAAPAGSGPAGSPATGGVPAPGATPRPDDVRPVRPADAVPVASQSRLPAFSAAALAGALGAALAVVALGTMMALVAYGGSGRPLPDGVRHWASRTAGALRHPVRAASALRWPAPRRPGTRRPGTRWPRRLAGRRGAASRDGSFTE